MRRLKPDTVYRSVELVFECNLESTIARMVEEVKKTFAANGFKYATLVIDVRNPSKEKMFP